MIHIKTVHLFLLQSKMAQSKTSADPQWTYITQAWHSLCDKLLHFIVTQVMPSKSQLIHDCKEKTKPALLWGTKNRWNKISFRLKEFVTLGDHRVFGERRQTCRENHGECLKQLCLLLAPRNQVGAKPRQKTHLQAESSHHQWKQ